MSRRRTGKLYNGLKVVADVPDGFEEPPAFGYDNGQMVQVQDNDDSRISIQGSNFGNDTPGAGAKVQIFEVDEETGEETIIGTTDATEAAELLANDQLKIIGESGNPNITIQSWNDIQINLTVRPNLSIVETPPGFVKDVEPDFPYSIKVTQGEPVENTPVER